MRAEGEVVVPCEIFVLLYDIFTRHSYELSIERRKFYILRCNKLCGLIDANAIRYDGRLVIAPTKHKLLLRGARLIAFKYVTVFVYMAAERRRYEYCAIYKTFK